MDAYRALDLAEALGAGERVRAVDIHRARAAYPFAARPAEGEGRVDVALDPDEGVQNHRPAVVGVDEIGVAARVLPVVRVPAIDVELAHIRRSGRAGPNLALGGA